MDRSKPLTNEQKELIIEHTGSDFTGNTYGEACDHVVEWMKIGLKKELRKEFYKRLGETVDDV